MIRTALTLALIASITRASLNIIDRRVFGHRNGSIAEISFLNNVIPLIALVVFAGACGHTQMLLAKIFDVRTVGFALIVQLVAYAFSYAFRHAPVHQIIVYSKLPDLIIPLGIYWIGSEWSWLNYAFAAATTIVCLPILLEQTNDGRGLGERWKVAAAIGACLTIQGVLSAIFVPKGGNTVVGSVLFSTSVILWRTIFSLPPLLRRGVSLKALQTSLTDPLILGRGVVTVVTQVTFVAALAQPSFAVAWPVFNSTALFSAVLSSWLLREKPSRSEAAVVGAIFLLTSIRFYIK